jgi:hypothetical protein
MDIPEWIMQTPPSTKPTEILMPVDIAVHPVTFYENPSGNGWQAELIVSLMPECDHHHMMVDEAFACGQILARCLADKLISEREDG